MVSPYNIPMNIYVEINNFNRVIQKNSTFSIFEFLVKYDVGYFSYMVAFK